MNPKMRISQLLDELVECDDDGQKQTINRMEEATDEMNKEELEAFFTIEIFNKMDKMIEEKKLSLGNAIHFLIHIGYCKMMDYFLNDDFFFSSLYHRIEKMIFEEAAKNDGRNEKMLIVMCECSAIMLDFVIVGPLRSVCVRCLLDVALRKDESKETQQEVEKALTTLSCINRCNKMGKELYLKEITDIIQYHQKHHILTKIAYQSASVFLMLRSFTDDSLKDIIASELHLVEEAAKELNELRRNFDWAQNETGRKEKRKLWEFGRWLNALPQFFCFTKSSCEGSAELISSLVSLSRASNEHFKGISAACIHIFAAMISSKCATVTDLLNKGAIDVALEIILQPTLYRGVFHKSLEFFYLISRRSKEKTDGETCESKGKAAKLEMFEKMEEEGYEDIVTSFHGAIAFADIEFIRSLSLSVSDCLFYV
ncbi:uncharacterized protein MONOS_2233 [Monocercomonoides exilis]|uniref:uncharacterized protein n=1 Tax=Monocercomonoides exilis TaxID=2049356 RepID=UPI0035597D63|nr:hypothetical protein MONOS_2233 [Monocercomonoides exilis]|eukprot:MONOS_2233.1-p1 / transcript=MONOS_2233.1 / gene=MONOS_2233 / organism=Monocercomonoides_exilis_PA203 / gene_product=unspecified product / transcript_product=unspecified product / location=Mono_scaffold00045:11278-12703(+) / protein_length=427 / sequence_SO=supercontig / SO=protein_coding / is_pseudo=false